MSVRPFLWFRLVVKHTVLNTCIDKSAVVPSDSQLCPSQTDGFLNDLFSKTYYGITSEFSRLALVLHHQEDQRNRHNINLLSIKIKIQVIFYLQAITMIYAYQYVNGFDKHGMT